MIGRGKGFSIKQNIGLDDLAAFVILLTLTFLFIIEVTLSLQWRMVHDTPLLHYVAFLVDRFDYVVYRDVFETSMPGTFLFHLAIGKIFGYGNPAFRLVDLAWLTTLLTITWHLMARFGRRVAWGSAVLFGLSYFQYGPSMSLQRDYLVVLPISLAVLLAASRPPVHRSFQLGLIGLLFGLVTTIKPHLALGLLLVLWFYWRRAGRVNSEKFSFRITGTFVLIGFLLPVVAVLLWLGSQGALPYFWEILSQYLPLHLQLTKTHQTITGLDRLKYLLVSHQQLGGRLPWLISACLGLFIAGFEVKLPREKTGLVTLVAGLAFLYSVCPVFAGQFFIYHWMPFQYFVTLGAALAVVKLPQPAPLGKRLSPILVLALTVYLALQVPEGFFDQIHGLPPQPPKNGRVDAIARFLQLRLEPGDQVQPLDWTGGAVHAMLLAQARAATPFIYDYHFYHHLSQPYIQTLRQRFIQKLKQTEPRFMVEIQTDKPWVTGPDTSRTFQELTDFLASHYSISTKGDGYIIYERND